MRLFLAFLAICAISFSSPAAASAQDGPPANEAPAFEPGFFSLGLSGLVGTRPDGRDDFAPTWTSGIDVGFRLLPFLSLGVRRITYAGARTLGGDRFAIGGAPALELALPLFPRVQPFVQVGAAVQARFGGGQGRTTGVAPFIGTGVRFFLTEWLSLAPEGVVHVPVTDGGFLLGHEVVPQGAIVLQGGVALAFHIQ